MEVEEKGLSANLKTAGAQSSSHTALNLTSLATLRFQLKTVYFIVGLICVIHLLALTYLARQHPFGTYATETDFYHFYAPDAERLASRQFPANTYQGPGYPATLALLAELVG